VAASLLLSDLRPKAVEPPLRWEYGLTARILYPVTLTPTRAWVITEGNLVVALNKNSEAGKVVTEVSERLSSPIPAAPSASGLIHYIPFGNGNLTAIEATGGNLEGGLNIKWRATPGGINNRSPFITKKFVYTSGDNSGVTCLARDNGAIIWKSDDNADRIIGANEEFVYIRDRQGRFLVYDARRATDTARKKSVPLGSANFSEFDVHVVNTASDRVYLAADNGLLVCLRDANPKYAKPMRMWPPPDVNPPKKISVETRGGMGGKEMGMNPEPKKEP
jgi:outer membrane protein assembly factor BamB